MIETHSHCPKIEAPHPWLLVFDLDGTLIDSSLDLCLAVNAAMHAVDAPVLPHESIVGFVGDGAAMLIRRALGAAIGPHAVLETDPDRFHRAFAHFLDYYHAHKLDNTRTYEGVLPSLRAIREQHPALPMAVLTNKPVRPSRDICDALDLSPFFFANYGGNSFDTKKPDPAGLLRIMEEARQLWHDHGVAAEGLTPDGVLMVGDSNVDVLTARHAGARSLGCRYGLSPRALESSGPDLMCDSPNEWPTLLAAELSPQARSGGQSQAAPRTPLESPC